MDPEWRVKTYDLRLPRSRRLIVTLRRDKSAKPRSTKTRKRLALPTPGGHARQIIIEYRLPARSVRRKAKKTSPKAARKAAKPIPFYSTVVRPGAVISAVLVIVGLSGVSYFGTRIVQGQELVPAKTFSSATPVKAAEGIKPLPRSVPTHITVPSVGIDADVMTVGKASDGTIQTPPLFEWVTGWYKYSPTPGEVGPAIIVGHVDTYKGTSVFWRLREVKRGDIINIERKDGRTAKFKVTALKQFDQDNFPTQKVYGNLKYPGLRLITCGGAFNERTQSYTQNTVVYAFLVKD